MLLLCLACTPAQLVFKQKWPLLLRKLFGNFAFFYACVHLATYVGVDQFFDWAEIGKDVAKRRFITIGMATWLVLLPLAVTSTRGWQRRLGFRNWKRLHRLVYLAGVGALVHFLWRFKTAVREPLLFGAALAVLFAVRIVFVLRRRRIAAIQ
jgi:sulfoxide reductase heme-binding subunit YedZ